MNTEQLTESVRQLMRLLDSPVQRRKCNVCDDFKAARFVLLDAHEVACEDCVKNHALLALEAAKCSAS